MEIGKIIRSKREELKMTQQQLADQLYVTRQTISKWELGKSEPDALSKKGLEKILAVQLVQESSSKENEEEHVVKKIQWFVGLVLFGIAFLPLRFLWVMMRRYWKQPWIRFAVMPVLLSFILWYLHSLKDNVFYLFLAMIVAAYLITSYYFFGDREGVRDN
ncbi:helix-turn-helix domain-containing protein [Enterococcus raffinosus]|uniref:helix-turn-helix domain-containing protein n=1 Tax=Enterococcus raffinosus TaxID=71452 RepID=UPI001C112580|nr:helix-turn-helix domain-containing protein [Enterococcus raffinosus]MBU5359485.1 helix-turn-helix domain-containing protein [Enterococcus raffinosus]